VAFGDVNLSKDGIREIHGEGQSPGAGGWPTVRYFNKDTGYGGAPYPKKTQKKMCDELGDEDYMQAYVEEMGNTSLCRIDETSACDEKEKAFIEKWKDSDGEKVTAQIDRLEGMGGKKMKPSLKQWVKKRLKILRQLSPTDAAKEEL